MLKTENIKRRIKELGLNQGDIAKRMNIGISTLNQKINNNRKLSIEEMREFSQILKIQDSDYKDYFYD